MNGRYLLLAARIEQTIADLDGLVSRAQMQLEKAKLQDDDSHLDGAALNLHGFYTGVEKVFEDIARTVNNTVPSGSEWHRQLLLQMSTDLDPIRPAVIQPETQRCLDEYRTFRHVVRNVYTFNLRPDRVEQLTTQLRNCYEMIGVDLGAFAELLRAIAE